jgi:ABC-type uncharacterized transport system involved in gliding motility auxiliary subunit
MSKRFIAVGGAAGLLVFLAILIAINIIASNVRVRMDLTEEKLFTLSEGTRKIVRSLPGDVELKFYVNDSSAEVPAYLKSYIRQVEDLLREYVIVSGNRVSLQKFDPKPDSDDEEWAQKYGLAPQNLDMAGPPFYFGLVAVSGSSEAAIPVLDPRTESILEYNVTRLIYRVTHPKKPVLGLISSLPVLGSQMPNFAMPGMPPQQKKPWLSFQDLRQDYDIRDLGPMVETIDGDIEALVVVHPKDLSEGTQYAIDQFVLRGGRLLAFVDPMCVADMENPMPGQQDPYGLKAASSSMDKLFQAWGVSYESGSVLADLKRTSQVRSGNNQVEDSPVWLSLRAQDVNRNDILTARLETLLMPFAGSFSAESTSNLTVTPLISSSDAAGTVGAMSARFGNAAIRGEFKRLPTARRLAVRLSGTFKTAFPGGKPKDPNDTNAVVSASAGLKEGRSAAVILVADADMIYDRFCVQELNFFGATAVQPMNDNMNFLANAVEQIAGSADLVGVRSRGTFNRPFDRVLALHQRAMEQWQDQERLLEQKLNDTQRQLRELQQNKDKNQRFILSPEQKKAIEGFRSTEIAIKKQLKDVRKNLRQDIERLGVKVKLINIAMMPAVVVLAGIGFWMMRRSR